MVDCFLHKEINFFNSGMIGYRLRPQSTHPTNNHSFLLQFLLSFNQLMLAGRKREGESNKKWDGAMRLEWKLMELIGMECWSADGPPAYNPLKEKEEASPPMNQAAAEPAINSFHFQLHECYLPFHCCFVHCWNLWFYLDLLFLVIVTIN